MKLFIKRSILLAFVLIFFYTLFYITASYFFCRTNPLNTIYVYGDSQTVQGIDLNELRTQTGCQIYSAAKHGSGVYDFLFFTQKVPNNSQIILSVSEHSQIRPDINEANTSPLNFTSLKELYFFGYSFSGFKHILYRGIKLPHSYYFKTSHPLYPSKDSLNYHTKMSSFIERYSLITLNKLTNKQNIYMTGIQNLIDKNCYITFIEFPYHQNLANVEERTKFNKYFHRFKIRIAEKFDNIDMKTQPLSSTKNTMYDYTHLNRLGANLLTKLLADEINLNNRNTTLFLKYEY